MSSRRMFSVALLGLLALPGLVAGTGFATCLPEGAAQETCCSAPMSAADVEGSCCAVDETPSSESVGTGDTCVCSHAPQAPAVAIKALSPTQPTTITFLGRCEAFHQASSGRGPAAVSGAAPAPPPAPAVFLLDCAFLT
ncbi:MAG: hypothetical protein KAJ97_01850 [Acidobacteria bacterium]|nr:hypothetical protein [Acidobacteriota bacterium]